MKIQPTELRIGNYVNLKNWQDEISYFGDFKATQKQLDAIIYHGDGFAKILAITKDEVELSAYGCDLDYYSYDEIEPIEINENWLLKFGFIEEVNSSMVKFWSRDDMTIYHEYYKHTEVDNLEWYFLSSREYNIRIKYVHQLQNLYFALTGKELKCDISKIE